MPKNENETNTNRDKSTAAILERAAILEHTPECDCYHIKQVDTGSIKHGETKTSNHYSAMIIPTDTAICGLLC